MAAGFRVLSFDWAGRGFSGVPAGARFNDEEHVSLVCVRMIVCCVLWEPVLRVVSAAVLACAVRCFCVWYHVVMCVCLQHCVWLSCDTVYVVCVSLCGTVCGTVTLCVAALCMCGTLCFSRVCTLWRLFVRVLCYARCITSS